MTKECDNIFCLHHKSNGNEIAPWNKTSCSFYEIDPFDSRVNREGFKIEDCEALKKYKKFGW